ncbi:MAG: HEPN domain-containing protein [Candidatus Methanoperedens sp.]|nr:HEPN domain-containing protein [Candidatus Methanoperedens sp.]
MNEKKKVLINYRIEQAEQAIEDAVILINKSGSPRSVINRAYYGMFYAVLALLVKIEKGTSKHSGAIGLFDAEFVRKRIFPKEMSQSLHKAFNLRQMSDYRELAEVSVEDARNVLQEAMEFISEVKEYILSEMSSKE